MGDRSASMLELKALQVPTGTTTSPSSAAASPACPWPSSSSASGPIRASSSPTSARSRRPRPPSRSASRASRSAPTTTARSSACAITSRSSSCASSACASYLPAGDNTDITQAGRVLHAGAPRRLHAPDRPRPLRERAVPALPQGRRRRVPRLARPGGRARDPTSTRSAQPGGRHRHGHGALDRRRERAREHPAPQARPRHRHRPPLNAAWFRLAGGLDFEEWDATTRSGSSGCPSAACGASRTTHLIDEGYWLWLIQLASGPISIGVCADPRFHPFEEIESFDGFLDWMRRERAAAGTPRSKAAARTCWTSCASRTSPTRRPGSSRPDRWTLVGEAGGFIDALYSPGSDFIALHEHLQHRADQARPRRRRGRSRSGSTSTTTSTSSCSTRRSTSTATSTSSSATRR